MLCCSITWNSIYLQYFFSKKWKGSKWDAFILKFRLHEAALVVSFCHSECVRGWKVLESSGAREYLCSSIVCNNNCLITNKTEKILSSVTHVRYSNSEKIKLTENHQSPQSVFFSPLLDDDYKCWGQLFLAVMLVQILAAILRFLSCKKQLSVDYNYVSVANSLETRQVKDWGETTLSLKFGYAYLQQNRTDLMFFWTRSVLSTSQAFTEPFSRSLLLSEGAKLHFGSQPSLDRR